MIDRSHELPLTRQAAVLRLDRGSLYYAPRPVPVGDLTLMRRMVAVYSRPNQVWAEQPK